MSDPPSQPKIYHITHLENLQPILKSGCLYSDEVLASHRSPSKVIGMSTIKARRLRLPVRCYPSTMVGEYVPFYFCPRSIMLYVIHMANHSELTYRGGQGPILHLQADLNRVVKWADEQSRLWAFTPSNAGAYYTESFNDLQDLDEIDWDAVNTHSFGGSKLIQERKAAEFLLFESFPWDLVEEIGVLSLDMQQEVRERLRDASHQPPVRVRRNWYY